MATIVCQGLQSCLQEPQLVEPRTLRLKLSSPIPHHLFSATPLELGFKSFLSTESNHIKELSHEEKCHYDKPATKNSDLGGWNFFQSISNNSSQQQNPPTPVYNKYSSSATRLNQKSLEMCTENLGNETGTILIENNIFESKDTSLLVKRDQQKQSKSLGVKKSANVHNFPPPLTTISGSESLRVRPHREDGRLILKAVKAPLTHNCLQAERSNGRLRLCFSKDFFAPNFDSELQTATNEEDTEANSGEDYKNEGYENDRDEEKEEQEVGDIDKVVLGEQEGTVCLIEEFEENSLKVGGEEGADKFDQRPSRCKEGGEQEKKGRLLNFEPFSWVAT
ncbi:protein FANTASTIC FOUR 3-like [Argentina anserina]|uniref:protein FANTASTIC FOUR 3-like n=1 Tax=Argentina anserina TaxID=57926 RepID=UPI0021767724|nr:protein FANTASTIC FOUR 3-like [Potentilla anserina]